MRQIDSANLRAQRACDRMHLDPVERIGYSVRTVLGNGCLIVERHDLLLCAPALVQIAVRFGRFYPEGSVPSFRSLTVRIADAPRAATVAGLRRGGRRPPLSEAAPGAPELAQAGRGAASSRGADRDTCTNRQNEEEP